jgi:hypothetical protein
MHQESDDHPYESKTYTDTDTGTKSFGMMGSHTSKPLKNPALQILRLEMNYVMLRMGHSSLCHLELSHIVLRALPSESPPIRLRVIFKT